MSGVAAYCVCSLALLLLCKPALGETITINIDCIGRPTSQNAEINGQFMDIEANSNLTIHCTNVRPEISFIILQTHSYRYDITLYQDVITPNTSVTGQNVGMYSPNAADKIHTFSVVNFNNATVKIYTSIHAYYGTAPIPGGCNLVSPVEVSPTLQLQFSDRGALIKLTIDPAKIDVQRPCGSEKYNLQLFAHHVLYRLYMSEGCYDEVEYFTSIRKMLTVEKILEYGEEMASKTVNNSELLRLFSAYPGTGSVYAVIVTTNFGSAVYVPTHSYGCKIEGDQDGCRMFSDVFTQVVCALMVFTGLFVCYFGHRCIKTEMFLMGLLAGAIVTHVVISQHTRLDSAAMTGAAVLSGVFCGATWWLLWWFYGRPVVSVLLPTMLLGFLTACVAMFVLTDNVDSFTIDASYWCVFFILMFLVPTFMTFATMHANMLCCSVLGSYATLYPLDMYIGSNIRYIVVDVYRRAVIRGFNFAYVGTPFQWRDTVIVILWITLASSGFLFQKYHNIGRAPFPPPPRDALPRVSLRSDLRVVHTDARSGRRWSSARERASERTPLLKD